MQTTNLWHIIGNTPLIQVPFSNSGRLFAKLEYLNPGGSIKDRTALFMIEKAEREGLLSPGGTIIDCSSGNYGIALAMIGAFKGYQVIVAVSEKISAEKLATIQAYGATVLMCPATPFINDPQSCHSQAVALHKAIPSSFMPNQYFNPDNAYFHESFLGPEIWRQTEGSITHFFAAAGTGGTITGVGRYLKRQNPAIKIIAFDSNNSFRATHGNPQPYYIEGMGIDFETPVIDYSVIDDIITVSDEQALSALPVLAQSYGILAGLSSGAVAFGTQRYSTMLSHNDVGVMIFGDSGRAYLSRTAHQNNPLVFSSINEIIVHQQLTR